MENTQKTISERLRLGETVLCVNCKKGHYITNEPEKSTAHNFYCSECDSSVNIDDNTFVVE